MGTDAMKALREWQRAQASEQDQAFRQAARALERLTRAETQRVDALGSLSAAVTLLEGAGVERDQVAALLGVAPEELNRLVTTARRSQPPAAKS
jgi:hypothetical protein